MILPELQDELNSFLKELVPPKNVRFDTTQSQYGLPRHEEATQSDSDISDNYKSVFDNLSDHSTVSSIGLPLNATDDLLKALRSSLLPQLRQDIKRTDIQVQISKILETYVNNLLGEAETLEEMKLARLLQRSRHKITSKVIQEVSQDHQEAFHDARDKEKMIETERRLEEWLKAMPSEPARDEEVENAVWEALDIITDSETDDEDFVSPNPQSRVFLTKGAAFSELRDSINAMVLQREPTLHTTVSTLASRIIRGLGHGTWYSYHNLIGLARNRTEKWVMRLKKLFRPGLPFGYRRIEWQCEAEGCDTWLYGDFDNSNPGELEIFAQSLRTKKGNDSLSSLLRQRAQHYIPSETDMKFTDCIPANLNISKTAPPKTNKASSEGDVARNRDFDLTGRVVVQSINDINTEHKKFLALCINTRKNYTMLGEIDVSTILRDSDLFAHIEKKYHHLRGYKVRSLKPFLYQPVNIEFVKFALEDAHRIDIQYDPPHIPPDIEIHSRNYEYTPCPLVPLPPIPANAFLHYLQCHADEGSLRGKKWFNRLPKKLEKSLIDVRHSTEVEKDVVGWGIHIIEGPNIAWITRLTFIVVLVSGILSVCYSLATKDISSGFAIGTWMVIAWATGISALYWQWKD
ncbi:hypothetical protein B0O99DRAFT_286612 [Bisporella sp. PMI_857]|nr:hypothetical protein B0O99DRAFT_286612 [Bisporella sp. PMI_857]